MMGLEVFAKIIAGIIVILFYASCAVVTALMVCVLIGIFRGD